MRTSRWTDRLAGFRPRDEDGFSLVDVTVAIGIFAVVMVLISAALATGMRGVLLGKRREVAAQEANRLLELSRSLAYDEIGLAAGDPTLTTDPAIVTIGGVKRYLVDAAGSVYEPILFATNTTAHPFNPHIQSASRGSTDLTNHVYVTGVDTDGDGLFDYKRVTARVLWRENGTAGPMNEVRAQTYVDEGGLVPVGPTNCSGGSCGTVTGRLPMAATTLVDAGSVSVKTDRGKTAPVEHAVLPTDPVIGRLPTSSGRSETRAVSELNCTGGSTFLQHGATTLGKHNVSVTVDDDASPTSPYPEASQDAWAGSPPDLITGGGLIDTVVLEPAIASPISCLADAVYTDGYPYEIGMGSGSATLTFTEDITGTGVGTNSLTVASVHSPTVTQSIDHDVSGTVRDILSSAQGSVGTVEVMQLAGLIPEGLIHVDAFTYQATVTSTDPTTTPPAPAVTVPGGITVKLFDPTMVVTGCTSRSGAYCVIAFDPASGFSGMSKTISGTLTTNLGLTKITYTASLEAFPPTASTANGVVGPNGEKRWSADYTALSLSAALEVELTLNPLTGEKVTLTDSEVDLQLAKLAIDACSGVSCVP